MYFYLLIFIMPIVDVYSRKSRKNAKEKKMWDSTVRAFFMFSLMIILF